MLSTSFRFYDLPDPQRAIDLVMGVIISFGVAYLWNKRATVKSNFLGVWKWITLPVMLPWAFYGLYKLAQDKVLMARLKEAAIEQAIISFFEKYS